MKNFNLTILITLIFFSANKIQGQFELPQETFGKYVTWGTVWGDYNNDGYVDLYLSHGQQNFAWEGFLYKNNGDGTFDSVSTAGDIVTETYTSAGSSWGDYNNDGFLDMYTANVNSGFSYLPNSVHMNDGDGTFTKGTTGTLGDIVVTQSSSSGAVAWLDYNNDGNLDAATNNATLFGTANNFLYQNSGSPNFTFSSISNTFTTSGVSNRAGLSGADFDEDGDIDIVVASGIEFQPTSIYLNDGSPGFDFTKSDIISGSSGSPGKPTQGVSWGDIDNDGDLDLYIANGGTDGGLATSNNLFKNNSGTLTEVTSGVGPLITDVDFSYASCFGDFDNDGDLDLFVGNDGEYPTYPSRLYENNGSGVFTSNTSSTLTIDNDFARSAAWADLDNDGDLDLMMGREGPNRLFINNGNSNNWSEINLIGDGMTTNKSSLGSLVKLNSTINSSNYTQIRDISSQSGLGSHNDLKAHFGLGDANTIETLTVKWHGAGTTSTYTDLPTNKIIQVKQGNLNVTSDVIKAQNFMYLFGNTGGSVEFTTADADGGTLTMLRTDSNPGGTFSGNTATNPGSSTITANAVYPDKYWTVTPTDLTGYTSTVYFDASGLTGSPNLDEVVLMKRTNSGSDWVALNTSRIGNTLYSTGITSFSEFGIGYEESGVLVETKIFIEGAYDTDLNEMTTTLNPTDIPTTSPYTEDARTVGSIPANVVDWILVELRLTDSGTAEASTSAFLHKDGRIVADDGITGQIELDAPAGSYYIVIKHRNHLSVMSSLPLVPLNSSTSTLYDFTSGSEQFYGTDGAIQIDD